MNTLIQFLTEQQTSEQQWARQIARDCKQAIDQVGDPMAYTLYRGISSTKDFLHKQVQAERQPRDTIAAVHQAMDNWFYNTFGIYYRSNSIACTGDRIVAAEFGKIYLVFPMGQFDFIWSPYLEDIGAEVERQVRKKVQLPVNRQTHQMIEDATEQILDDEVFWEGKLREAIKSGNEIMVHTKEYYAVSADLENGFRYKLKQAYKELYG